MIASISPGLASPLTCFSISRLSIRTHISLKTSSCPLVWCLSCTSLWYERWKREINKSIHRSMTKSILYECKVIGGLLACNPGCPPIGQACKTFPQWNSLNYTVKIKLTFVFDWVPHYSIFVNWISLIKHRCIYKGEDRGLPLFLLNFTQNLETEVSSDLEKNQVSPQHSQPCCITIQICGASVKGRRLTLASWETYPGQVCECLTALVLELV